MCTTVVVGRNRSATGSVLLAHSEELGRNSAHKVEVSPRRTAEAGESYPLYSGGDIPQAPALARYVATKIFDKGHYPGEHTSGVNEHGVAVANNMALMRGIPEESACVRVPGGVIWTELVQLVLERARTAREGAALVGELCGTCGLSYDSGTMIAVADPRDAWWVELARDGQWVAERVDPGELSMRANAFRIREVDRADADRFLCSPNLVDYARERGWYREGREGLFDFAAAYGDPANQADAYNLDRHRAFEDGYGRLEAVRVSDLTRFLREVYEGTPLHRTRPDGSPFRTGVRTIARMDTEASVVLEPRAEGPPHLAHRVWCSLATSLTSVYLPFHLGIEAVAPPFGLATPEYDARSAYWLFAELARLADYGYARAIGRITGTWRGFEAETSSSLAEVEARAAGLPEAEACALLTEFDGSRAEAAFATLQRLLAEVKTCVFREESKA
jgi:dipeptidase